MTEIDNKEFVLYKSFKNQGMVYIMTGVDKTSPDYNDLLSIACFFAKKGKQILVLAPVHYKDRRYHDVYGSLVGTMYYRKCPDLMIDGVFYEYESYVRPFDMEKVVRMVSRGCRQSKDIIIDTRESSVTQRGIHNRIQRLTKQRSFKWPVNSVWLFNGTTVEGVYKTNRGASPSISAEKSLRGTNP